MRRTAIPILITVSLLIAVALPVAVAADTQRHSGTVVSIDPPRGVMVLDEVGPWRIKEGQTVLTRRTITLTPTTTFAVYIRADVPGGFARDFLKVALDPEDVVPGDFVTVDCLHEGDRLVARSVSVAELADGARAN